MFAFFKIFPYLMPFLKEMVLGKKSWKEGFRDNKKKTVFAIVVMCSFALNFATVPKLAVLATKYITLNKEYTEYRDTHPDRVMGTQKHPLANDGTEVTTDVKTTPSKTNKPTVISEQNKSNAADIQAEFDRIRAREETEH